MENESKHLRHLHYLEAKLEKAEPQSNDWWTIKGQLEQVRIAYSQSWNLAKGMSERITMGGQIETEEQLIGFIKRKIEDWQSYFYDKLTEPLNVLLKEEYEKNK